MNELRRSLNRRFAEDIRNIVVFCLKIISLQASLHISCNGWKCFRIEEFGELDLPSSSSSSSFSAIPANNPQPQQLYLTSPPSASSLHSQVANLLLTFRLVFNSCLQCSSPSAPPLLDLSSKGSCTEVTRPWKLSYMPTSRVHSYLLTPRIQSSWHVNIVPNEKILKICI